MLSNFAAGKSSLACDIYATVSTFFTFKIAIIGRGASRPLPLFRKANRLPRPGFSALDAPDCSPQSGVFPYSADWISSTIAVAAPFGSAACVTGRPTTR